MCPVRALPVSCRRRLNLCTALSTSPLGYLGLPAATCICVVGLSPIELSVLFILVLRGSVAVIPNLSLLWLHNLGGGWGVGAGGGGGEGHGKAKVFHSLFFVAFVQLAICSNKRNSAWKNASSVIIYKRRHDTKQDACPVSCSLVV